jgi:hypothetical protein
MFDRDGGFVLLLVVSLFAGLFFLFLGLGRFRLFLAAFFPDFRRVVASVQKLRQVRQRHFALGRLHFCVTCHCGSFVVLEKMRWPAIPRVGVALPLCRNPADRDRWNVSHGGQGRWIRTIDNSLPGRAL